jgi:pimeloyl-ACP methyl ester carboxylesterase
MLSSGRTRSAVLGAVGVLATTSAIASARPAPPPFQASPCPADVFPEDARVDCGALTVPERRGAPNGRTITVAAAIVHAPSRHPKPDPIVFLDGGPSFGAISPFALGSYFADTSYAEDHDLILVDTRGTGFSRPRLGCPEFDDASVASFYSKPFVDSDYVVLFRAAVAACRDRLTASGIDLAAYNSAESAADLEDLRRALGYRQWNLLAISADGVLGLTYMRLYPGGIRSAVLDSPQDAQYLGELDDIRGLNEELERVFAGCASNAACNAAYPGIRARFLDLAHQLQQHPEVVSIPAFEPNPVSVQVDGVSFYLDALHGIFAGNRFEPENIHTMLAEIWRATHGELDAVTRDNFETGPFTSDADTFVAQGKTMSYLCHDQIAFLTHADLTQAAGAIPELAPYLLDPDFGLINGPAGCAIWDVGAAAAVQHQPVSSTIPALVLAGEYDTGVPPSIVRRVPPTLSSSFFYEFPAGAHLQLADFNTASPCAREIAGQFLDAPTHRPDASCIASVAPFDYSP